MDRRVNSGLRSSWQAFEVRSDPAPVRAAGGERVPETRRNPGDTGGGPARRAVEEIVPRDRPATGQRAADAG